MPRRRRSQVINESSNAVASAAATCEVNSTTRVLGSENGNTDNSNYNNTIIASDDDCSCGSANNIVAVALNTDDKLSSMNYNFAPLMSGEYPHDALCAHKTYVHVSPRESQKQMIADIDTLTRSHHILLFEPTLTGDEHNFALSVRLVVNRR